MLSPLYESADSRASTLSSLVIVFADDDDDKTLIFGKSRCDSDDNGNDDDDDDDAEESEFDVMSAKPHARSESEFADEKGANGAVAADAEVEADAAAVAAEANETSGISKLAGPLTAACRWNCKSHEFETASIAGGGGGGGQVFVLQIDAKHETFFCCLFVVFASALIAAAAQTKRRDFRDTILTSNSDVYGYKRGIAAVAIVINAALACRSRCEKMERSKRARARARAFAERRALGVTCERCDATSAAIARIERWRARAFKWRLRVTRDACS